MFGENKEIRGANGYDNNITNTKKYHLVVRNNAKTGGSRMNICVCIKQVPDTTEIKIDPVKHTLIRDGVPSIVNPYDTYALENAARIRDEDPDTKITVITMGPAQAGKALRTCLSIAADKAYLISDRVFGGSDTLATSYILSQAIKHIEELEGKFDLIFCGRQAIDGDTAQVGPEIAECLGYPQVTCAVKAKAEGNALLVTQEGEEGKELLKVSLPCVVTFTKPDFPVRYPKLQKIIAAAEYEIQNVTAADLKDLETGRCGLKGSPTKVKSTFVPVHDKQVRMIQSNTTADACRELASILGNEHII